MMKWIAVREIAGDDTIELMRLKHFSKFSADKAGFAVVAHANFDGKTYRIISLHPAASEAGKLLAQLNGPVGEVPYK